MRPYKKCLLRFLSSGVMAAALSVITPATLYAQRDSVKALPNGTEGLFFYPKPIDSILTHKKNELEPNEFEGTYSTFRIGLGYIGDYTAYSESSTFKRQMDSANIDLKPQYKTRDFRVLASGRFLQSKRYLAWKFAYMFDGDKNVWLVRETGITIGVPELFGHIFIGRTKEGFSMIKVMNGHSGITNERQMALDPIPILADGIKWFGYMPKTRIFWNLGYFNNVTAKNQSFATFQWQYVARIGWMPINDPESKTILHLAANLRYGKPKDGQFAIKSRPESNPTPQLINTGTFTADHSSHIGYEAFFTKNRFTIGSEAMVHNFYSKDSGNHSFAGGDIIVSFFFTKTSRPYNTTGSIYGFVPVKKSILHHGIGEVEGVLHISTFNLNDGNIRGGQMTRITPMVNWYLTKFLRWEFIYGYGILDRYNLKGNVNFFETRVQVTMM